MKKLLYITTVSRTVNAFLIPHIEMLLENGYKVDVACYIDKEINKNLLEKNVEVFEVPFRRSPLNISNLKALKKILKIQKENKYDIIHVHTPVAAIFGRLLKIRFPNLKTIYTAHGYHFLKGGSKLGWLIYYPIEKVMAKLTDITININKEDYEITKNKLKPKKCYFINGVGLDLNLYKRLNEEEKDKKRKELKIEKEDFIIIMIAELNENKNQIQLIKAMEILNSKYDNIKSILVGEGKKLKELKEEVKNRGIENKVIFLGFREDINELINISDIGILLSYREGLPRNIIELMANGRKVIATNIRGCRDIINNKELGTLVEVGEYKTTAKAIEKYYKLKDRNFNISKEINIYDVRNIN